MSNVVNFPDKKALEPTPQPAPEPTPEGPLILVCTVCACRTFEIHADGHAECANCGAPVGPEDVMGVEFCRADPPQTREREGTTAVLAFNERTARKFAVARAAARLEDAELLAVAGITRSGETWVHVIDPEIAEPPALRSERVTKWLEARAEDIKRLLLE